MLPAPTNPARNFFVIAVPSRRLVDHRATDAAPADHVAFFIAAL
jgi:hypothetical protein